jgi:hypothetical protein
MSQTLSKSERAQRKTRRLLQAARMLRSHAESLKDGHTIKGRWDLTDPTDRAAKASHDEHRSTARFLVSLARGGAQ